MSILEFLGLSLFTALCCAAVAWWTGRTMRYQQGAATEAVQLMSSVAITMNENAALLLEFQRQMMSERAARNAKAPPAADPQPPYFSPAPKPPKPNGRAEAPPPNIPAGRIEN